MVVIATVVFVYWHFNLITLNEIKL